MNPEIYTGYDDSDELQFWQQVPERDLEWEEWVDRMNEERVDQ
jgi:hypothetical protein